MTVEQHLQMLIGGLAMQLCQKDAALDAANAELAKRKPRKVKSNDPRSTGDLRPSVPRPTNGVGDASAKG